MLAEAVTPTPQLGNPGRHHLVVLRPRYLDLILGIGGLSLIVNYPGMYGLFLATWVGIYFIVLLEERELRQRFGAPYEEYCRNVPRFLPRSWSFLRT